MKLNKILKESLLIEADTEGVITNADSGKEVLQKVEIEAEANDVTNSAEVAAEITGAAEKIDAQKTIIDLDQDTGLGVENKITKALDECLRSSQEFRDEGIKEVANIMICGLPGSGKTASVYDWAKRAKGNDGKPVNIVYLNMKNNDLDAYINGYTAQDKEDPDYTKQLISKNLDDLTKENSILFLDEYNRQTEQQIRASVLTLINEHYVVGKNGGRRYFPNFLFTIAVMNPSTRTDRGAASLNDAEKSRFLYYFDNMDSDVDSTKEYLDVFYGYGTDTKHRNSKCTLELKKEHPDYDKIEKWLRIKDLGTFLVSDDTFEYDGIDKLGDLDRRGKKMLNQRSLTSGLAASSGDVTRFINWLKNGANFLTKESSNDPDTTTEILLLILSDYVAPTRDELFKAAGITEQKTNATTVETDQEQNIDDNILNNTDTDTEVQDDIELEDDDDPDFWTKGTNTNTADITPNEAAQRIQAAMDSWKF